MRARLVALAYVALGAVLGVALMIAVLVAAAVPVPVLDTVRDSWWRAGWTYEP